MRTHVALSFLLLLPLSACGDDASAKEVRDNLDRTWGSITEWSSETWSEFMSDADSQVDDLENRLSELRERAEAEGEELSDSTREAVEEARRKLRELRDESEDHYGEAAEQTREAIREAQDRLDRAWKELSGG